MPNFLETKLKQQYGANSDIPYRIMNSRGFMRGNKITAKGGMVPPMEESEAILEAYGNWMTFEEAQAVVQEIMENTPVSEQIRLLRFFGSPRAEILESKPIKFKSRKIDGPGRDSDKKTTMAVASGKI